MIYVASIDRIVVKEEVGGIWKEAIVIYFKLISLDFHGGTK
jgi:hypothetical protein